MIKFFRTIRQRMLKENRFSRYFLYAIGEIVLVVIGILIALQINNWNEGRKDKELVRIRLTELLQDLELDRSHFAFHLDLARAENQRIDSILGVLGVENADEETLMNVIRQGQYFPSRAQWMMIATTEYPQLNQKTFLSLQNSGQLALFEIELQRSIGSFYGYHHKYSFMIEEIIKNKNIIHSDFVRTVPFDPDPTGTALNAQLMDALWSKVDRAQAQISFITLLNTFHELNVKSMFFNNMRLGKTELMIEEMTAEIHSMGADAADQHGSDQ